MLLNAIGISKTEDLRQGRGFVRFSEFRNGLTGREVSSRRDLGNVSNFTLEANRETVTFFSSRKGLKDLMKEAVSTRQLGPISLTGSEWSANNLSLLLAGPIEAQTQDFAAFGAGIWQTIGFHEAGNGRSYPLYNRFGERLTGIGSGGTVGTGGGDHLHFRLGSATANIVGEDLELAPDGFPVGSATYARVIIDRNAGEVFVPAYVPFGGALDFRINVAIPSTPTRAGQRTQIQAFSRQSVKGELSVRMYDACSTSGLAYEEWIFHSVELIMDGTIPIIDDSDFNEFTLSGLLSKDILGRTLTVISHELSDSYTV